MEAEATAASVIKFGEISPIRQYFQSLGQFCKDLFRIWQNFEPTLAIILCFWGKFSFFMAKYWINNLGIWSHEQQQEQVGHCFRHSSVRQNNGVIFVKYFHKKLLKKNQNGVEYIRWLSTGPGSNVVVSHYLLCGQSYKGSMIKNYDSRVVIWGNFKSGTTLES